jgi:hypothetical protein
METLIKNLNLEAKGLWLPITISIGSSYAKKNIGWREFYITMGVIGLVTWIVDGIFARFLDLVDFGHPKISGIGELITYTFITCSYLFKLLKSSE